MLTQNKNDIHLVYTGNDNKVIKVSHDKSALERVFASELTHHVEICRFIQKQEVISFEVTIYGKNTREGDFKLIIATAKSKKSDLKNDKSKQDTQYVIEPPCSWVGNSQRGIFRFMVKLENESLLMRMDEDINWFSVLYFPKSIDFYNIQLSLCKTIRTVSIRSFIEKTNIPGAGSSEHAKKYNSPRLACFCKSKAS